MYTNPSFDTGVLRMGLKVAEDKVKAFGSGEKYVQMKEKFRSTLRGQNRKIHRLECELGQTLKCTSYFFTIPYWHKLFYRRRSCCLWIRLWVTATFGASLS